MPTLIPVDHDPFADAFAAGDPEAAAAAAASNAMAPATTALARGVGEVLRPDFAPLVDLSRGYVGAQADLASQDWSQQPLLGVGAGGELAGRIPAFARMFTSGLAGPVPGGALGAGPSILGRAGEVAAARPTGRVALDTTDQELHALYPMAGDTVDGRLVREHVPNMDSIEGAMSNYELLDGVREVPMHYFTAPPEVTDRTRKLADRISQSGELNPLIVAVDREGPYILEGGHRYDALQMLGAESFPARVALDLEDLPDSLAGEALTGGPRLIPVDHDPFAGQP